MTTLVWQGFVYLLHHTVLARLLHLYFYCFFRLGFMTLTIVLTHKQKGCQTNLIGVHDFNVRMIIIFMDTHFIKLYNPLSL